MKRFFAFLLALFICLPIFCFDFQDAAAATSYTKLANPVMTLKNLGTTRAVQQFYFYNDKEGNRYVFTTQRVTSNVYLSRCLVSEDGLTATRLDYVILQNFGHGEALAVAEYDGQVYVYVNSNSITDTTDALYTDTYWARNVSRFIYTPDASSSTGAKITDEKRLTEFVYATSTGGALYSGSRCFRMAFGVSPNSDRIMFWIKLKKDSTYKQFLCCYSFSALNKALSAASSTVSMSTMGSNLLAKIEYDGALPNGSMQGMCLTGSNTLYFSGGSSSQTPMVYKYTYTSSSITLKEIWTVSEKANVEIETAYMLNGAFYCIFIDDTTSSGKKNNTKIYTLDDVRVTNMHANHHLTLKGLPVNAIVQNFAYTEDKSTLYVSQNSGANTYISRCIPNGKTAVMKDYILLSGYGLGESLDVDESIAGKTYLWVGGAPVYGSDNYATTAVRLEYKTDPSAATGASFTAVTVNGAAYASATGAALDTTTVKRVAVSHTKKADNRIIFRTHFTSEDVYYTVYTTSLLNQAINAAGGTSYSLKNAASLVKSSFVQNKKPNDSFQGFDADGVGTDNKFFYTVGGSGSKMNLPLIYKFLYTNGGNSSISQAIRIVDFMQTAQGIKVYDGTIYVAIQPISDHKNQTVIRTLSTTYTADPVITDDFSLKPTSALTVNEGMVRGVALGAGATEVIGLFSNINTLRTRKLDGTVADSATVVGTGFVVESLDYSGTVVDSATIVISGDTNGDGIISASDCLIVEGYISGVSKMEGCFYAAGDVNPDDYINTTDYVILENILLGKE